MVLLIYWNFSEKLLKINICMIRKITKLDILKNLICVDAVI